MMRKMPSKSISSNLTGVSPDKRTKNMLLDKSEDANFTNEKWENLARYVKNRFNSNRVSKQVDAVINRTPKDASHGLQNQSKYLRNKNKVAGSSINKKKTPEPLLKTFLRGKDRTRDTKGKSLIKEIIGKRKDEGLSKYRQVTQIGTFYDKDRNIVSRCGSLESKGKKQHEISASNLSQLRISHNLKSSGVTGKGLDFSTKDYSDQKYLNNGKNSRNVTSSQYVQNSHTTNNSINTASKQISTRKTNNFINNNTTATSSAINMYSLNNKNLSDNKHKNYLNGLVGKAKEDNQLKFNKVEVGKNGGFEFFNSSSDRNLASSLNFNVTSPKNINYLMNDKRVSYNSKQKLQGKFSVDKNQIHGLSNSNIRESVTNESYSNNNGRQQMESNDYFYDYENRTEKSFDKSQEHSNDIPFINIDNHFNQFSNNNELVEEITINQPPKEYNTSNINYAFSLNKIRNHKGLYRDNEPDIPTNTILVKDLRGCINKFSEEYFESQIYYENNSNYSRDSIKLKETDDSEFKTKMTYQIINARSLSQKILTRKLVNNSYLMIKFCLYKLCENCIADDHNSSYNG